jgi:hypothetical protein
MAAYLLLGWAESRRGEGEVNRMIDKRDGVLRAPLIKCGSEPAREEAVRFNIDAD